MVSDPLVESKNAEAAHQAALGETDGQTQPILIKRIPFICRDILDMKEDISNINGNIKWGVRLVVGAVILALIYVVLPK